MPPIGPAWFTTVMGTGIVAVALVGLPVALPGAVVVATGFWLLALGLLVVLTVLAVRGGVRGPVTAFGAPPMALMTVGAGALLVGYRVIGAEAARDLATVLWLLGTVLGVAAAVVVPRLLAGEVTGAWLMPVVPPVVSAATGAELVPHALCWALLVLGLVLAAPVAVRVVRRALRTGLAPADVPTLWIVLGPLGQSVTAVHHLGGPVVAYAVPVLGLAALWLGVAAAVTLRTARTAGLPFGLGWWAFTFPVGTLVTGTSGLAQVTGSVLFDAVATILFVGLAAAWAIVATRTLQARSSDRTRSAPSAWNSVGNRGPRSAATSRL